MVEYEGEGVVLGSWNHVVVDVTARAFLTRLAGLPDLQLVESDPRQARAGLAARVLLASLVLPEGRTLGVEAEVTTLPALAEGLTRLVNLYSPHGKILRARADGLRGLEDLSPMIAALLGFPRFRPAEITDGPQGRRPSHQDHSLLDLTVGVAAHLPAGGVLGPRLV